MDNKQELIERIEDFPCEASLVTEMIRINKNTLLGWVKELDEPQKVTIPQFVADWIEYCKFTHVDLQHALIVGDVYFYNYANQKDFSKLKEFLETENNQETFARAWLDGYTVEKEKRYTVKMRTTKQPLFYNSLEKRLFFSLGELATQFTHKELEDAGFCEVFDSPLFEVEEVTE